MAFNSNDWDTAQQVETNFNISALDNKQNYTGVSYPESVNLAKYFKGLNTTDEYIGFSADGTTMDTYIKADGSFFFAGEYNETNQNWDSYLSWDKTNLTLKGSLTVSDNQGSEVLTRQDLLPLKFFEAKDLNRTSTNWVKINPAQFEDFQASIFGFSSASDVGVSFETYFLNTYFTTKVNVNDYEVINYARTSGVPVVSLTSDLMTLNYSIGSGYNTSNRPTIGGSIGDIRSDYDGQLWFHNGTEWKLVSLQ